jgi:mono/diheme cytochrome c family protein
MKSIIRFGRFAAAALLLACASSSNAAELVDFASEIQPIFSRHCYQCHGPQKQRSGFRLDQRAAALAGGDLGEAIVAGRSADSPLLTYIAGGDPQMQMPPEGPRLSAAEIGRVKLWIDQGAKWPEAAATTSTETWWSLRPLVRPPVPEVAAADRAWVRTPVDAFVIAQLRRKQLAPAPEADRRTLIRRLAYDLTGLPPEPAAIDAFVNDPAPDAYERLVDRLLASPRYGERWARHWLDVVHYADTHGYDKDKPRLHAWPYRDYVIRALNEDKPYARFVQEQLAGDVLHAGTRDGIEALGFIAAGPWDLIGHMEVPESKVDGKIARLLDRDDMVANTFNAFNSLTVQCARCHNHKFDPISQEAYYGLQAVFAALDRADKIYDFDPAVGRRRSELAAQRDALQQQSDRWLAQAQAKAGAKLAAIEQQLKKPAASEPVSAAFGYHSAIARSPDEIKWVQIDLGQPVAIDRVVLHPCFDNFNHIGAGFGFPQRYVVEACDDPRFAAGVERVADFTRADVANPLLKPISLPASHKPARYVRITATRLAPRLNDFMFALAEVEIFDTTGVNWALKGAVSAADSIDAPPRWQKPNLVDNDYPGRGVLAGDERAALERERERLLEETLGSDAYTQWIRVRKQLADRQRELAALPNPAVVYAGTVHHGKGNFHGTGPDGGRPREIHLLRRGDVRQPGPLVEPGVLPIIPGVAADLALSAGAAEGERRAALARWITRADHPLTWRSIVNRAWQYHFGRGLVDSPNDFGHMGRQPSHPELLDWLAVEFRDGGQSLKRLHRLLVTSAVYRQASQGDSAQAARDAQNENLWRMNRRKLEAEAIRDTVLSVAGKLDLAAGGPGFRDFVVEHPEHSPHYQYHLADPDDARTQRRSIYRFIVRSQGEPLMSALDCADPSMSVDKRNQSSSALQALALLNNRFMVTMAGHFAERVKHEAAGLPEQIDLAFRLALGRHASAAEREQLAAYANQHGLANACRLIFNLSEFTFID